MKKTEDANVETAETPETKETEVTEVTEAKSEETGLEVAKPVEMQLSNDNSNKTMWNDPSMMKQSMQMAKVLASTPMVPGCYKNQPGNCLVAIDFANRMGISPMMVMQNLDVIQGNPAWRGQACVALVNNCGRFTPIKFEEWHNDDFSDYYCIAYATEKESGEVLKGTKVDKALADACGWTAKNGSYWLKMPEQMARYRAAAFFARTYCPEALMGLYTTEEQADIKGTYGNGNTKEYKLGGAA